MTGEAHYVLLFDGKPFARFIPVIPRSVKHVMHAVTLSSEWGTKSALFERK